MTKQKLTENEVKVLGHVKVCAIENDWKLNSDKTILNKLISSLAKNLETTGFVYCPCRISRHPDNICPCSVVELDIAKDGHCKCRLFYKKDNKGSEPIKESQ